jgi:hypothetical protein
MAAHWFRIWHGMIKDPKFRTIARVAKQPISLVISTFLYVLEEASQNDHRGVTHCDAEDIGSLFDVDRSCIEAILDAFQGRLLNNDFVINWEKRQPKREDSSKERTRNYREKLKTDLHKIDSVTHCDAARRNVTLDKDTDKDTDKELISRSIQRIDPEWEDHFVEFWTHYPRKIAKAKCKKKFLNLCKNEKVNPHNILTGLEKYLPVFAEKEIKFVPHPFTWLNQKRWEDEINENFQWG